MRPTASRRARIGAALALSSLSALPPLAAVESRFLTHVPVATGLESPIGIAHAADGSGRLFVIERCGKIKILKAGGVLPTPFLDLGAGGLDLITCGGERGLLGLAFHPDYPNNGFFYVNYTNRPDGQTVVARFEVSGNPDVADPGSHDVLLVVEQPFANHNGGNLQFGPDDGYLYIGMGDGGSGGDPGDRAQDLGSLLGKMLRIDVDGDQFPGDPNRDYAIPPDNPFVDAPGADEIWAYGLRNPWRWSFDRQAGDLFIGDVGQGTWEEVSRQPAGSPGGENYGWDVLEGGLQPGPPGPSHPNCFENDPAGDGSCADFLSGASTLPILEYSSAAGGQGCSVTGGYVYRGSTVATLAGQYVYGDFCTGRIWRAEGSGNNWTSTLAFDTPFMISSFGESESGKLYFSDLGGAIRRIAPYSFQDVPPTAFGWTQIESLHLGEVTSGCSSTPPRYCPGATLRRGAMAALLLAAKLGPAYTPPACVTGNEIFADVPATSPFCPWIEDAFQRGITSGCALGPRRYCPGGTVNRGQMAAFLLAATDPPGEPPPPCVAGQEEFVDVPASNVFCPSIEEIHARGITGGCSTSPPRYCPARAVTRAQSAVFLVDTFALPTKTP